MSEMHLMERNGSGAPRAPRTDGGEDAVDDFHVRREAHAAARWARTVVSLIDARSDPRTITQWSGVVFASPGALRTWCRIAGIAPRRSLIFARLLRAVIVSERGRHKLEDLLDIVDRRTLQKLLGLAGLANQVFPTDVEQFLHRQTLVRDADTLFELRRALRQHRASSRAIELP